LVKPDPISKTASKKQTDLTPEKNLVANILKLCSALREEGLDRQASEIEKDLLLYKAAASKAPPDVDPQVIRDAHPQGSVRVSNIDGDAMVEDILDQHLQSLFVALKQPTGRINTASQVIESVKFALGQDIATQVTPPAAPVLNLEDFGNEITALSQDFRKIINGSRWGLGWHPITWRSAIAKVDDAHQSLISNDPITLSNGREFQKKIYSIFSEYKYGDGGTLSRDETLEFQECIKKLNRLMNKYDSTTNVEKDLGPSVTQKVPQLSGDVDTDTGTGADIAKMKKNPIITKKPSETVSQKAFNEQHASAVKTLGGWYNKIKFGKEFDAKDTAKALDWIAKKAKAISDVKKDFDTAISQSTPDQKEEISKTMLNRLSRIIILEPGSFESFRRVWIGQ